MSTRKPTPAAIANALKHAQQSQLIDELCDRNWDVSLKRPPGWLGEQRRADREAKQAAGDFRVVSAKFGSTKAKKAASK